MLGEYAAAGGQYTLCIFASLNRCFIPPLSLLLSHLPVILRIERSGFPVGILLMSYLGFNGRAAGSLVMAPCHKNATLVKVMSAWEATFDPGKDPTGF